jgi:7-keto-8-aminopelargonate synthetase-like enzyme
VERFSHNNAADLRTVASSLPPETVKMLVVEGIYSMEGHIAHLPELLPSPRITSASTSWTMPTASA